MNVYTSQTLIAANQERKKTRCKHRLDYMCIERKLNFTNMFSLSESFKRRAGYMLVTLGP